MSVAKRRWGRLSAIGAVALLLGGGGLVVATSASAADIGMNSFRIYMKEGETKSFSLDSQFIGDGTRLSSIISTTPIGSSPKLERPVATGNSIKVTTPTGASVATEGMSWDVIAEVANGPTAKATETFQIIVTPFSCPNQNEYRGPVVGGEKGNVNVRSQCQWDAIYVPDQLGIMGVTPSSVVPNELSMRGLPVTQASTEPHEIGSLTVDATGTSVTAGPDIVTYRYTDTVGRTDVAKAVFFVKGQAAQLQRKIPVAYEGTVTVPATALTGLPDQDYGPDTSFVTSIDTKAANGTVTVGEDGALNYAARPGWSGTESVTVSTRWRTEVTVMDDVIARTTVEFTVAPQALGPAPVANDISITMNQGEVAEVDVFAAATGDRLMFSRVDDPQSGTVERSAKTYGVLIYTPEPTFTGVDSIHVVMVDASQRAVTMTVHITVLAPVPAVVDPPAPTPAPAVEDSAIAVTGASVGGVVVLAVALAGLGIFLVRRRTATS